MVETLVQVERGDTLGEAYRRRITEVYVRSFAEDFVAFSRDTDKLADAFEHMLLLERFYIALVDGEPHRPRVSHRGRSEAVRTAMVRDPGDTSGWRAGCSATW